MRGSIRDIYTIVPSKPGKYKIPKIEFSYFDIKSKLAQMKSILM